MTDAIGAKPKRPRISVDIEPTLRRQLRLAAARKDITIKQYVIEAIVERLRRDTRESADASDVLTAATDPVLADVWDNEFDAAYDRL